MGKGGYEMTIQEAISAKICATLATIKYTKEQLDTIRGLRYEESPLSSNYDDLLILEIRIEGVLQQLYFKLEDLQELERIAREGNRNGCILH
jgi:hypothetical protein